jgi:hypothetical protein
MIKSILNLLFLVTAIVVLYLITPSLNYFFGGLLVWILTNQMTLLSEIIKLSSKVNKLSHEACELSDEGDFK